MNLARILILTLATMIFQNPASGQKVAKPIMKCQMIQDVEDIVFDCTLEDRLGNSILSEKEILWSYSLSQNSNSLFSEVEIESENPYRGIARITIFADPTMNNLDNVLANLNLIAEGWSNKVSPFRVQRPVLKLLPELTPLAPSPGKNQLFSH